MVEYIAFVRKLVVALSYAPMGNCYREMDIGSGELNFQQKGIRIQTLYVYKADDCWKFYCSDCNNTGHLLHARQAHLPSQNGQSTVCTLQVVCSCPHRDGRCT